MVHNRTARSVNSSLRCPSKAWTPVSHYNFNSSINGAKYTSMSLPGCLGPEISRDNIMNLRFMHNQGGRLYVTRTTGQQLYLLLCRLCGLIPSDERARRRFLDSLPNVGHFESTCFQAGESAGCRSFPSSILWLACQVKL